MNSCSNSIIILILGISTIIQLVVGFGWFPKKVRDFFYRSKAEDTIDILKEMGVDVDKYRRSNISMNYTKDCSISSMEEQIIDSLKK